MTDRERLEELLNREKKGRSAADLAVANGDRNARYPYSKGGNDI